MSSDTLGTRRRPAVIGLLGGIAAGKSFVSRELQRLGCVCIDADQIGHDVLEKPEIIRLLRREFGDGILTVAGEIDRQTLGAMVFGKAADSQANRKKLEAIVHPQIRRDAETKIAAYLRSDPPPRAIIVDAPLLIETGWVSLCDYLFYIDTTDEIRLKRALERGWTEPQWRSRESAQASLEEKRRAATHFLPGDADPASLRLKLQALLQQLDSERS
jgi:dephospho-CoA kinase